MKTLSFIAVIFCISLNISASTPLNYSFPENPAGEYKKDAELCYKLIERQAHYILSITHPWNKDSTYMLTTASAGGNEEHLIRPNTGAIAILSFLYRFGPYDETIVGINRKGLLEKYIIPMMEYLTTVHKTGSKKLDDGRQWGAHWQSAHWTHQLAQGACSIWKDIPNNLQKKILKLVEFEADIIAGKNPEFGLRNDSKSEEDAWNAGALSAAIMLMPDNPKTQKWNKALQRWILASYLCPADSENAVLIDGKPLYELYEGANIYNDYTLENHGLAHPDYMTACTLKGEIMIDYLATGRKVTDACMFNVDKIYNELKNLLLPSTGYMYPTGQDWAIFRHCDWTNMHAFCLYYYNDGEALYWLRRSLNVIDRMQKRHDDGRIYGPEENYFPSSQTLCGLGLVDTWKMLMLAKPVKEIKPTECIAKIYSDGRFFIRRTPNAVHSISWGKKIQIQSMAYADDPIMAPDWQNCVGHIKILNEKNSLATRLEEMSIDTLADGIEFKMTVMHGNVVRAEICAVSKNDGTLSVSEKLTAEEDFTSTSIETLNIGILNHKSWIEEKGFRNLECNGKVACVPSMSKKDYQINGKNIQIDGRLKISCNKSIKDGVYHGSHGWESSKIIDRLILNNIQGERTWKKGETINSNTITIEYKK